MAHSVRCSFERDARIVPMLDLAVVAAEHY